MDETPNWNLLYHLSKRATSSLQALRGTGIRVLAENVFSLSVLQAVTYLIPLITLPYLVRVLGVEKYGLVAFAQAVIQYFIILSDYGFNLSAALNIASNRHDLTKVSQTFSAVMLIRLTLMVAVFGILYLLVVTIGRFAEDPLIFLLSYGLVLGNVLFPFWFYQGMEMMKYFAVLTLVARCIFLALIFVFIRSEEDYLLVPVLHSLGFIVAGVISLWLAVKRFHVKICWPGMGVIRDRFRSSFQFFLSTLSSSISSSLNTFILGFLMSNRIVGYYAAAERLFIALRALFYPLVQALYPYMANRKNVYLFKRIFYLALSGAIVIAAGVFMFSEPITSLIFGSGFETSAKILRLFALIVPIAAASLLLSYPLLAALGYERYANYSNAVGSLFHIFLVALFIPALNPNRIVLILMAMETLVLGTRVYGIIKHKLWQAGV
ncbi:MAG: oligosaccharide flippase family protein [Candidatus Zixiibacteriota bacterium]